MEGCDAVVDSFRTPAVNFVSVLLLFSFLLTLRYLKGCSLFISLKTPKRSTTDHSVSPQGFQKTDPLFLTDADEVSVAFP